MKEFIYIHTPLMNNWEEIYKNLISFIPKNKRKHIFSIVLGEKIKSNTLINPIYDENPISYGEYATIQKLWNHANNEENCIFYYCHLKGITYHFGKDRIHDRDPTYGDNWRKIMSYFLFKNMTHNKKLLIENDVIGSLFSKNPWPHYSGNFWAATDKHIKKLKYLNYDSSSRLPCESWIGTIPGKYFCFYNHDMYDKNTTNLSLDNIQETRSVYIVP